MNANDVLFTYTALILAKSITIIKKRFVMKRYKHENSLSSNRWNDPTCFVLAIEKIKYYLEQKKLFNLFKESFWRWAISLCIVQLKTSDNESKELFYKILHEKFNLWDYIDYSLPSSNRYRALHYIKYQKSFPTINIAYLTNQKYFNLCLVSIISLLSNTMYEKINIILLYNDINKANLDKIYMLKKIHSFNLQILFISDNLFKDFPLKGWTSKETWYRCLLANMFPNLDKILYLDCDTMIRGTLLPIWEINMNNKLIAAVEDISLSKEKSNKVNLKDSLYINCGVLLINAKEWRKTNLYQKINNYVKNNEVFDSDQSTINFLTDTKKIRLNPEFNYMEVWWKNYTCQYDNEYLELYKKKKPTIVHFTGIKPSSDACYNSYRNEFLKYNNLLNALIKNLLIIPIVLSSDDKGSPYMYTTMVSILENGYNNTFYVFYLLVSPNFPKSTENKILKLNDYYKCSIHFIYVEKVFDDLIMKISHITLPTY